MTELSHTAESTIVMVDRAFCLFNQHFNARQLTV